MSIDVIYGTMLTFRRDRKRNLRRQQPVLEACCLFHRYRIERMETGEWRATKFIVRSILDSRCEQRAWPFQNRRDAERWCIEDFFANNPERGRCRVRGEVAR